jgi:hypothetical protein
VEIGEDLFKNTAIPPKMVQSQMRGKRKSLPIALQDVQKHHKAIENYMIKNVNDDITSLKIKLKRKLMCLLN